ncbi:MAG: flagellar biosynthesis anti-sigma factor FlgM [Methylococcaceae bacterium]
MEISKQNTIAGAGVHVSKKVAPGPDAKSQPSGLQNGSPTHSTQSLPEEAGVMVSQLAQRMMGESSVDEARVARLSAQIQSGQYQIDDRRVATKMIELDESIQMKDHGH